MAKIITFEILSSNLPIAKSILDAAKISYALINNHQFSITGLGYNAAYPTLIQLKEKDKKNVAELLKGL